MMTRVIQSITGMTDRFLKSLNTCYVVSSLKSYTTLWQRKCLISPQDIDAPQALAVHSYKEWIKHLGRYISINSLTLYSSVKQRPERLKQTEVTSADKGRNIYGTQCTLATKYNRQHFPLNTSKEGLFFVSV